MSVNLHAALIYSYALRKKVLTFSFNTTVMDIKAPKITRQTLPCILNLSLFVLCEGILKKRYTLFKWIIQCHAKPHPTLTESIDFLKCRSIMYTCWGIQWVDFIQPWTEIVLISVSSRQHKMIFMPLKNTRHMIPCNFFNQ